MKFYKNKWFICASIFLLVLTIILITNYILTVKSDYINKDKVYGSSVINAIQVFPNKRNVTVKVKTLFSGKEVEYNSKNGYNVNNPNDPNYINPTGIFKVEVIRDANNEVKSLSFIQN